MRVFIKNFVSLITISAFIGSTQQVSASSYSDKLKNNQIIIGHGVVAYQLPIGPRDQIRGLFILNGSPTVLIYNTKTNFFRTDDFLRGIIRPSTGDLPVTQATLGQQYLSPQVFKVAGSTVTLLTPNDIPVSLMEYFYNDCLPPTQSYISIERQGQTYNRVLLYHFSQPRSLFPRMQCEQDLFASPNTTTDIIDPELIGLVYHSTLFLTGESYTTMPAVIAISGNFDLNAKNSTVGFYDQFDVDQVTNSAFMRFQKKNITFPHNDTPAHLAAEINAALLSFIRNAP